jgi:FkbM family methyltransferase
LFYIWGMENEKIVINGIHCLPGDSDITNHIRNCGTLKWDTPFALITKILGPGDGRVMVDIGAYIGDSVKWFIDDGWVCHAFEPQKDAYECLVLNVGADCSTYNIPIGSSQKVETIQQVTGNLGARSLDLGGELTAIPLDSVIENLDFIKIDAEGFEPFILDGCKKILETKPIVAIEINHVGLSKYGFTEDDILNHFNDHIAIEVYFYAEYQYDLLLIPMEKYNQYKDILLKHPMSSLKIKHIKL